MSYEERSYRWIDAMLRPGSEADVVYRKSAAAFNRKRFRANAGNARNDLVRQGGRIVPQSVFRNVFLGGSAHWQESDVVQIDGAIAGAMHDRRLENVMRQYFPGQSIACDRGELLLPAWERKQTVTRSDVPTILRSLFAANPGLDQDLDATLFNILLPRSVVLSTFGTSSLAGLGGFHGSLALELGGPTKHVYYSVNVFSEEQADGHQNGIPVFNPPWKNVVATLYHEINEFRTDPDVERANAADTEEQALALIGWVSDEGEEVGDHPLSGDQALSDVFREILLANDSGRVAVQFMYSNLVHKAQGPVDLPSDATRRHGHGVGLRGIESAAGHEREARFGKLFPGLPARGDVAPFPEDLGLPGGPMDGGVEHQDSTQLFAVLTYFGQFLDHDITFDPTSLLEREQDPDAVRNFRTPALELDSVYGTGPAGSPFLYDRSRPGKMLLGAATNDPAEVDLPRNSQRVALIGDPRNDENLIVAQLHFAFLKFHNAIVDQLDSIDDGIEDESSFHKAQRLVRWHYQWLVLHEFLPPIAGSDTVGNIMKDGRKLYDPVHPFIPVEFSVGAYRFGHSMVQPGYRINDGFGALLFPPDPQAPPAGPGQPRTDLRGGPIRFEERVNWKNFLDTGAPPSPGAIRFASKIDTRLARPLINLPASVVPAGIPAPLRSLAVRNLRRSVTLRVPSGLDVARAVAERVPSTQVLTDEEIWKSQGATQFRGSVAPLWYYLLREAEQLGQGERLGPVGARIVAEVIIGLLQLDQASFLSRHPAWTPVVAGRESPAHFTFADFFRIAGTDTK